MHAGTVVSGKLKWVKADVVDVIHVVVLGSSAVVFASCYHALRFAFICWFSSVALVMLVLVWPPLQGGAKLLCLPDRVLK